jgi:hypothetical protein
VLCNRSMMREEAWFGVASVRCSALPQLWGKVFTGRPGRPFYRVRSPNTSGTTSRIHPSAELKIDSRFDEDSKLGINLGLLRFNTIPMEFGIAIA